MAGDLAEEHYKAIGEDSKYYFPLQDPKWDVNRSAHVDRLQAYQDWIAKGLEKAIPKTINWSALYAIRQGPSESPSKFLDRLCGVMCCNTPLDPGDEVGTQQLVSLFLGQSAGDIQRKLQKLRPTESRNLKVLLDEAWRVYSNREDGIRKVEGGQRIVATVQEEEDWDTRDMQKPQRGGKLGRDQCAWCKQKGHWKNDCLERKKRSKTGPRIQAYSKED